MTEDEKEDLVYALWAEFRDSIGATDNDQRKYDFIAGARAAIHALEQSAIPPRCPVCGNGHYVGNPCPGP